MNLRATDLHTEILLELALAAGTSLDIQAMLDHALPVYARKLGCAMVGVLAAEDGYTATIASVPRNLRGSPHWAGAASILGQRFLDRNDLQEDWLSGSRYHFLAFRLNDFGLLLLGRSRPLSETFRRDLDPVVQLLARTCCACRDFRDRVESETRLRAARDAALMAAHAKRTFIGNIGHEIRTPLNGVVGLCQLLLNHPLDREPRNYVEMLQQSASNLCCIVDDILDFARLDAFRLELEPITFSLSALLAECAALLMPNAAAKGLSLVTVLSPRLPDRVVGDPLRLRQVVVALLANAVKFTDQGEIRLAAEPVDGNLPTARRRVRISVGDSGIGIDEAKQAVIFDAFTQADDSLARRAGGTGLGLTIASRLVELMGGRIRVRSTPGEGSIFSFELAFALNEGTGWPSNE